MTKIVENNQTVNNSGQKTALLLDTLAHLGTGIEYQSVTSFLKRAVAKYRTQKLVFRLIDLHGDLYESYWQTKYCSSVLLQHDKTITSTYCNNRWCIVCNRIRSAKLIKGYLPEIRRFENPQSVTLTIVNVPAENLKIELTKMIGICSKINNLFRHKRDFRIKGLRKIECTYNKEEIITSYHLHLHWIIEGVQAAEALKEEWLRNYPDAEPWCQKIKPANEESLIELFKYATKLVVKDQGDVKALDVIFRAFKRKRVFQPVGLKRYVDENINELESQYIKDLTKAVDMWVWKQEISDWINMAGKGLTGCQEFKNDPPVPEENIIHHEIMAPVPSFKATSEHFTGELRDKAVLTFEADKRSADTVLMDIETGKRSEKVVPVGVNINTGKMVYGI